MPRVVIRPSGVARGPAGEQRPGLGGVDHVVDPQRRLAGLVHRLQQRHVGQVDAHGMDAGPAVGGLDPEGGPERARRGRRRSAGPPARAEQAHGVVHQHAGELAVGALQDLAAERRRRGLVDVRRLQRRGVGDQRVAVGAAQQHRRVAATTASMSPRLRKRPSGQPVSIQPRPPTDRALVVGDPGLQPLGDLGGGFRALQVQGQLALADPRRWAWLSVKPGNSAAPFRSMTLVFGPDQRLGAGVAAGEGDPPVADRDGLDLRAGVHRGVDRPAPDHQVGRASRAAALEAGERGGGGRGRRRGQAGRVGACGLARRARPSRQMGLGSGALSPRQLGAVHAATPTSRTPGSPASRPAPAAGRGRHRSRGCRAAVAGRGLQDVVHARQDHQLGVGPAPPPAGARPAPRPARRCRPAGSGPAP